MFSKLYLGYSSLSAQMASCYFPEKASQEILFITETWIKVGDLSPFSDLVPAGCTLFYLPRSSGHGGGLAVIQNIFFVSTVALFHLLFTVALKYSCCDWNGMIMFC